MSGPMIAVTLGWRRHSITMIEVWRNVGVRRPRRIRRLARRWVLMLAKPNPAEMTSSSSQTASGARMLNRAPSPIAERRPRSTSVLRGPGAMGWWHFDARRTAAVQCGVLADASAFGRTRTLLSERLMASRIREAGDILTLVEPRFGPTERACTWFEGEQLPGFGGATAEQLVEAGRGAEVYDFTTAVGAGIYS